MPLQGASQSVMLFALLYYIRSENSCILQMIYGYTQGSTSITSKVYPFPMFLMLACACICCITGWLCLLACYTILSLRSLFALHASKLTQQTRLAATFFPLRYSHYAFLRRAINYVTPFKIYINSL